MSIDMGVICQDLMSMDIDKNIIFKTKIENAVIQLAGQPY